MSCTDGCSEKPNQGALEQTAKHRDIGRLVGATLPSHIAGWINDVRTKRSVRDRLLHAEATAERLIDVLGSVITVHETNRIVMFSDYLSRQIPVSYAANAF